MTAARTGPLRDPVLDEAAPYRLAIPNLAGWLSSNDDRAGKLYHARRHTVAAWRAAGRDHAERGGLPPLPAARVIAELCFRDHRRRDPSNYGDTAKAVLDGLVDAAVLPDDSSRYVLGPDMRLGPVLPSETLGGHLGLLVMHIYPLGGTGADRG
jgi:crossover junction endodeoxyribonuclease RusA